MHERVLIARLRPILAGETGLSSSGFPFLDEESYALFRDTVPLVMNMGPRVLAALETLAPKSESSRRAADVVRRCVLTAAVTAPSDLWLLKHVLGALAEVGLCARLIEGEVIDPEDCEVLLDGVSRKVQAEALEADLSFLLSRGLLWRTAAGFARARHLRARDVLAAATPTEPAFFQATSDVYARLFSGDTLNEDEHRAIDELGHTARARSWPEQDTWLPTFGEIELGARLLPVVLGLRGAGRSLELLESGAAISSEQLSKQHPECGRAVLRVLTAAGVIDAASELTSTGRRVLERGPGPMGIIEAYRPYLDQLSAILVKGRGQVWVSRGTNIAASQDANRRTFERANDALDRMCEATGFSYQVYIEHAIGRGEATRQRFERSGASVRYVGADLEDAAIDACVEEQKAGSLPANMVFVRGADIGQPSLLIEAMQAENLSPNGAVMIVGNGFHEVRDQTDARMIEVFRGYHDAGILLLFTEESALSVDDLLHTAWNTYHAGFKYVHDKSGQGLRPAESAPAPRYGLPLRASWSDCALQAGYVRADQFCSRSRTIYPTAPRSGHNPSISKNHFYIPATIASNLKLDR